MITDIKSDRMVIISDLHLGNPFSKAKASTVDFLMWAAQSQYDIIINGDGFEIAQVSFSKIARDVPQVFHALKSATSKGNQVYYVVGNHDIVLEHFLNDWGGFKMAPFLNLTSGQSRIRVEHGHLYDPFFIKRPELYEFLTWLAGFALHLSPSLYKMWIKFEKLKSRFLWAKNSGIPGEHTNFITAATELSRRGFDYIIFGHTHHAGRAVLPNGSHYINSGSWLIGTPYIEVLDGVATLKQFHRSQLKALPGNSAAKKVA